MGTAAIQARMKPFHANLEALRGIAALLVVLHHLALNSGSLLASIPFLRQGWMFVDLFFVLSGYVIAAVHAESEASALAALRFLTRRFFRLYPLHFVTLVAALIVVDLPSGTAAHSGYAIMVALNLSMTHAWGLVPGSVLNGPSWSISTEWGAYLIFAWICLVTPHTRRRLQLLCGIGLASLVSLIVWRGGGLDGDLLFRLPRCLMSFALGAAVWGWCRNRPLLGSNLAALSQLVVAMAMFLLLIFAGRQPNLTLVMPLLSAAMIAAMVRDPGSMARSFMEAPVPQWLGRHSYSLYLVHMPLFHFLLLATPAGWRATSVGANLWIAMALCALFGVANATYALVEKPWREYGRRLADAPLRPSAPRTAG